MVGLSALLLELRVVSPMIAEADLKTLILESFPGADVAVFDLTGTQDHFRVWVSSSAFAGCSVIQRHKLVRQALQPAYDDGRLHAAEISTDIPESVTST